MSDIKHYKLRVDNIDSIHQYDLMMKLSISLHPSINDTLATKLVMDEIETRKQNGTWIH